MEEDEYSRISMPIEPEIIPKQSVDYNLEKTPGSARMSKNLPMEKVQSALRLLSEMSRGHTIQIGPESIFVDLESKLKKLSKLPKGNIKPYENDMKFSIETPYEIVEEYKRTTMEEYESDEESKENLSKIELEKRRQKKLEEEKARIKHRNEEILEADRLMLDILRNTSRGTCLELAENPDKECKKGICKPTPTVTKDDLESEDGQIALKKICLRGKEKGVLTCIERSPDYKQKKYAIEEEDTVRCDGVIETTYVKPLNSSVTSSKTKSVNEKTLGQADKVVGKTTPRSKNKEHEDGTNLDGESICSSFNIEGIITDEDEAISEVNISKKGVNVLNKGKNMSRNAHRENQVAGMCQCCKCAVCKCEQIHKKRMSVEESKIEVKKVKDLQSAPPKKPAITKYSWDTIDVPDPWDFVKDQEDARKAEKKELMARASKLEKEQEEALAAFNAKLNDERKNREIDEKKNEEMNQGKDGELEDMSDEDKSIRKDEKEKTEEDEKRDEKSIPKTESEKDWDSYKAIEWAGLRHEYTERVKTVDLENLSELASVSWTSQPPPQLVLGTVTTEDTKTVSTSDAAGLSQIDEVEESVDTMGPTEFKTRIRASIVETEKQMEQRRQQMSELKKIQERRMKRRRDLKKGVQLTSVSQIHSVEKEKEVASERHGVFDPYTPFQRQSDDKWKRMSAAEINENMLPLGLKREADILRKSVAERAKTDTPQSILSIARSLPPYDAERLITLHSIDDMTKSCTCLPGYCKCGSQHWAFESNSLPNLTALKAEEVYHDDSIRRTDSELKAAGIYPWKRSECPCSHSSDEMQTSPTVSKASILESKLSVRKTEEYTCPCKKRYEQTVVIVKPDAMIFEDVIRRALVYVGGLHIVHERKIHLSPEQVSEIYADKYYGSESYPLFVLKMSQMPVLVLSVAGLQVMDVIHCMIGNDKYIPDAWFLPESIKRRIMIPEDLTDALHISEDAQQSATENRYFFPQMLIEPVPRTPDRINDFCKTYLDPTLSKGLAAVARAKPVDPVIFLAEWLLTHNPFQPWYKPGRINLVPT